MKKRKIMWTRVSGFLAATVLFSFCMLPLAAAQQATPTISVTVNKSMVFRLAERAKTSLRIATRSCGRGGRCPESTPDQRQSCGYNVADRFQRKGRRCQLRSDSSPGCWGAARPAALTVAQ